MNDIHFSIGSSWLISQGKGSLPERSNKYYPPLLRKKDTLYGGQRGMERVQLELEEEKSSPMLTTRLRTAHSESPSHGVVNL